LAEGGMWGTSQAVVAGQRTTQKTDTANHVHRNGATSMRPF